MRLRLCWTAALASTVLTGAAFADVTVSQSNDPTALIEGEFSSLFGAEHKTVAAVGAPRLQALAKGPEAKEPDAKPKAAKAPQAEDDAPARGVSRTSAKAVVEKTAKDRSGAQKVLRGKVAAPDTALIRYDDAWLANQPVPTGDAQWQCLATAIYFEARGESLRGQFAVAEVVLNRTDSPRYPSSICGVVQQTCQFSYTCDGRSDQMTNAEAADRAKRIARLMIDGAPRGLTMGATHFHTRSVNPAWAGKFPRTASIGAHLFYRQP